MIQTTTVAHRTVKVRDLDIFYREAGPKDAPAILLSRLGRERIPFSNKGYRYRNF